MSSAAHAFTLGSPDGKVDRDTLDGTAEAVRVAAEVGLQGIASTTCCKAPKPSTTLISLSGKSAPRPKLPAPCPAISF